MADIRIVRCVHCSASHDVEADKLMGGRRILCTSCNKSFSIEDAPAAQSKQCDNCEKVYPSSELMLSSARRALCRDCGPGLFRERDRIENELRIKREKEQEQLLAERERQEVEKRAAEEKQRSAENLWKQEERPRADTWHVQLTDSARADFGTEIFNTHNVEGEIRIGHIHPDTKVSRDGKRFERADHFFNAIFQDLERQKTSVENKERSCPFCGEKILAEATVCKHCRSNLEHRQGSSDDVAAAICGLLISISVFLPVVNAGILSLSFFAKFQYEGTAILAAGIIVSGFAVFNLVGRHAIDSGIAWIYFLCGVLGLYIAFRVSNKLNLLDTLSFIETLPPSIILMFVGSAGILAAALRGVCDACEAVVNGLSRGKIP